MSTGGSPVGAPFGTPLRPAAVPSLLPRTPSFSIPRLPSTPTSTPSVDLSLPRAPPLLASQQTPVPFLPFPPAAAPPPSPSRKEIPWMWGLPAEGSFVCHEGSSGRVIALGLRGGRFFAFDGMCFHMGRPLWSADAAAAAETGGAAMVGDIEDGDVVRCPHHHMRIALEDGASADRGGRCVQRVHATRSAYSGPGGALEVFFTLSEQDDSRESDKYNKGKDGRSPAAERAAAARAAMAAHRQQRRAPFALGLEHDCRAEADAPFSATSAGGDARGVAVASLAGLQSSSLLEASNATTPQRLAMEADDDDEDEDDDDDDYDDDDDEGDAEDDDDDENMADD